MQKLILASASHARAVMLTAAGVEFEAKPAPIDERAVEAPLIAKGRKPATLALALAEAKALAVCKREPQALVIGADQTLEFGERHWTKPTTIDAAREQLLTLAGGTHRLHAGAAVARDGKILWRHVETARLAMRALSGAEVDDYLHRVGEAGLSSVGAYQIEGLGVRLFDKIDGDFFAILGLPLLPLLKFLREQGAI